MRVAPVSADLLIKVALGVAVVAVIASALRRATASIGTAAQGFWDPITSAADSARQGIGRAADAVYDGASWAADASGGSLYTRPVPALPAGYEMPWYMGGAMFPIKPAEQADVRRVDNAIEFASNEGYGPLTNEAGYDFRLF